jgi:hypothetical protein
MHNMETLIHILDMLALTCNMNLITPPLVVVALPNPFNFALLLNLMVSRFHSLAHWCLILPSSIKSPGPFNVSTLMLLLNVIWLPSEGPWTPPTLLPPLLNVIWLPSEAPWTSPYLLVPPHLILGLSLFLLVPRSVTFVLWLAFAPRLSQRSL